MGTQFNNFIGDKIKNLQQEGCPHQYNSYPCVRSSSRIPRVGELMLQYSVTLLGTSAAWALGELLFLFSDWGRAFTIILSVPHRKVSCMDEGTTGLFVLL